MNPNLDPTQDHYRGFLPRWSTGCREPENQSHLEGKMTASSAAKTARLGLVLFGIGLLGCSRPLQGQSAEPNGASGEAKTLRVLVTSDVAGFVEPCGCVKDQLGGLDRFATALLDAKRAHNSVFLEAGSLFIPRANVELAERDELTMRAETLAEGMRTLGLLAWTPGTADAALGESTLAQLAARSGASLIRPSTNAAPKQPQLVRDVSGIRVGFYGFHSQSTSSSSSAQDLAIQLRAAARELEMKGAKLKVALITAPHGTVTRAVHQAQEFQLVVVSNSETGLGADSDGEAPQLIDSTLVVHPPNHLRGFVTVDFIVKDGNFKFEDGSGVGREEERMQLGQRIVELAERLKQWKQQNQDPAAIAAREADLKRLREKLTQLSKPVVAPQGSHFTVLSQAVGNNFEHNPDVKRTLDELGRRINLSNRDKFAGLKAPPPVENQPTYVGVKVCESCHKPAAAFWRTTRHAGAYKTLVDKDRQYTLECVGCHVTGYEQPGGSSVADVETLKDVQCENCHGPGSAHAQANSASFIKPKPERDLCATKCHHSPHVESTWNVNDAWPKIVGAGHGE